jgi:hypothetical protein
MFVNLVDNIVEINGIGIARHLDLVAVPFTRDQRRAAAVNLLAGSAAGWYAVNRPGAVFVQPVVAGELIDLHFVPCRYRHPCRVLVRVENIRVVTVGYGKAGVSKAYEDTRVVIRPVETKLQAQDEIAETAQRIIEQPQVATRL